MAKGRRTSGGSAGAGTPGPAVPEDRRKEVAIKCQGAATRTLKELEGFQGALKTLSDANAAKLKKEILELGFSEPISVWQQDGHCYILNGHQRVAVLLSLRDVDGYRIPPLPISLIEAKSLDEAKRKVLALTSQYGEMTEEGLLGFMAENEISLDEIELSFNFPEIKLESLRPELDVTEDEAPEPPAEPITEKGELILLGRHRLLCGDCREEQIGDPLLTDPPYGVGYECESWDDKDAATNNRLFEWLNKQPAPLVYFCGTINLLREINRGPCKIAIWHKPWSMTHSGIGNGRHHWEPILMRNLPKGAYLPTDVISHNTDRIPGLRNEHSCPKPVGLFAHLIQAVIPDGSICDPFLGSGTTLIATEQLGRTCYGIEIEPRYCDVTVRRYYNLVGWDQAPEDHRKRWSELS